MNKVGNIMKLEEGKIRAITRKMVMTGKKTAEEVNRRET